MAGPVRFPSSLTTFPSRTVLGSYPISTSPAQISITEDFIPYRAGDYTVTTAVAGTAASFAFPSGMIKLATSASNTDTEYLARNGASFQFIPGNRLWFNMRIAYPRSVANANDTNLYFGLFSATGALSAATDAIYFFKPSGGTAVNFIIKKASTTTTFNNVADLSLPSGLFGDTNAVNALLNATVAGNAFTVVSVNTAGAGYQVPPLVLSTATSGVAGNVPVTAGLGQVAFSQTNPVVPIQTTQVPYASIASPFISNPGSGYTNAGPVTTYLELEPIIDLGFYFDGKGRLYVGVNGRQVMSIIGTATELGVIGIAAGGTVNVATSISPSFYSTTQLTTSIMPFQPPVGSPINLVSLLPMFLSFGMANTTANIRNLYVDEYYVAQEYIQ